MKVLLLFPMADGQTGPAIKYAFEQLGHTVHAVDAKIEPENSYGTALEFLPHLVFCSRTPSLTHEVLKIKKDILLAPKIAMWNTDTRDKIEEWERFGLFPLIRIVDYYFVPAKRLIPEWKKLNKNTFWSYQGLQDEVYHKVKVAKEEKQYEVSFIGSITGYHAWRVDYLQAVMNAGFHLKVYGCMGLPQIYNKQHNEAVAMSKINLGMSGWENNESYVSVRNMKIIGAGGFLLERSRPALFGIFPESGIATYENSGDLLNMIQIFLKNDEARKKIAEVGYQWVHKNSTYTHRIQEMLKIMGL